MELTPEQRKNMEANVAAMQKRLDEGSYEQGLEFVIGEITEILNRDRVLECCGEIYGYCTCPPCCDAPMVGCGCE